MMNKIGARLGDPNYRMESCEAVDKHSLNDEMTQEVENG